MTVRRYTTRPISDRSDFTGRSVLSSFDTSWTKARELLFREVNMLGGKNLVLEVDVREQDLRIDGEVKANVRIPHPVRIAFESKHGPLIYGTDKFSGSKWRDCDLLGWQANVYAIALGLEALRKVDRYGIARRGEQYRGYRALESGIAMGGATGPRLTWDEAMLKLSNLSGIAEADVRRDVSAAIKLARTNWHPDRNDGFTENWDAIDAIATFIAARPAIER